MEITDFFDFHSKLVSSTFQAGPIGLPYDGNLQLIRGDYARIDFPVICVQDCGHKLTDILDTGYAALYLISERMKKILEDNVVTGWKCFPIRLFDKKKNEIFGYHGFSVIGRCGPIDDTKAVIIEKRRVPTGPICKFYKGLYVGLDRWDKTDFFFPEGTTWTIISKRVADILKRNKITNLCIKNLADIECRVEY